jgi:hypothetical protein
VTNPVDDVSTAKAKVADAAEELARAELAIDVFFLTPPHPL